MTLAHPPEDISNVVKRCGWQIYKLGPNVVHGGTEKQLEHHVEGCLSLFHVQCSVATVLYIAPSEAFPPEDFPLRIYVALEAVQV